MIRLNLPLSGDALAVYRAQIAINGLQAGAGSGSGVTPGSYNNTNLTVDSQGRVTAASSGASVPLFVDNEIPGGTIDNTNPTFTLNNTPTAGSQHIYRNGLRLTPSVHYTISGLTITFLAGSIPQVGDKLLADYRR